MSSDGGKREVESGRRASDAGSQGDGSRERRQESGKDERRRRDGRSRNSERSQVGEHKKTTAESKKSNNDSDKRDRRRNQNKARAGDAIRGTEWGPRWRIGGSR